MDELTVTGRSIDTSSEVPSRERRRAAVHVVLPMLCSPMTLTVATRADTRTASSAEPYSSQLRPDSLIVTLTEKKLDEVGAVVIDGSGVGDGVWEGVDGDGVGSCVGAGVGVCVGS